MEHEYKSHSILVTAWASLNPDGFIPEIRISNQPPAAYRRLKISQLFTTKEEAESQEFELAKKWIDGQAKLPLVKLPSARQGMS